MDWKTSIDAAVVGFIFLLCNFAKVSYGELTEFPSNTVIGIDNNSFTEFRCKSDLNVRLKVFIQKSTERKQVFTGYELDNAPSYFEVVKGESPGEVHFRVKGTEEAAQTYICQEPGTGREWSAELIAVAESVKCEKIYNKNSVILNCSIEFRGNWAPEFEWTHNGNPFSDGIKYSTIPGKMVISTVTIRRNSDALAAGTYNCTANFSIRGKPQQTNANNVPEYSSSASSTVEANEIIPSAEPRVMHQPIPAAGIWTQYQIVLPILGLLVLVALFPLLLISLDLRITGRKASQTPRASWTIPSDVNESVV